MLIPYPHATDDHQTANAHAFAEAGGGWLIPQASLSQDDALASHRKPTHRPRRIDCRGGIGGSGSAGAMRRSVSRGSFWISIPELLTPPTWRSMPHEGSSRTIGPSILSGIGGIGMSGIAEVLHNLGYRVQGSDLADSANVRRLRELGIPVAIGHAAGNLDAAEVVVISSAVKSDNPEVAARAGASPPGGAARRNAGRADAAQMVARDRRDARQDDDDLDDRRTARSRRSSTRP